MPQPRITNKKVTPLIEFKSNSFQSEGTVSKKDKTEKTYLNISLLPKKRSKSEENFFFDAEIEKKHFTNEGQIGEGGTSITYKIIDKRTKVPMCKKVLKYKNGQATMKDAQRSLNEFKVLYEIDHPCICKAYGINFTEPIENNEDDDDDDKITTVSLFLEFLDYSLNDVLNMKITNTLKTRIVLDVAHAMNFIHKKGLMHRDLKVENIMLNSFFETKLVDFGLVKINESVFDHFSFVEDSLTKGVGTLAYMSPEMASEEDYDYKTDVYSFGVVLHFMFVGCLPKQNLKEKLNGKKIQLPDPSKSISRFCINLISQCLAFSSANRPSFEDILHQLRENSYELANDVDPSILTKRDRKLEKFY